MKVSYQIGFFLTPDLVTHIIEEKICKSIDINNNYNSPSRIKRRIFKNKNFKRNSQYEK